MKKFKAEMSIEDIFFHNGELVTHDCKKGEWWGNEICEKIDIEKELNNLLGNQASFNIEIQITLNED